MSDEATPPEQPDLEALRAEQARLAQELEASKRAIEDSSKSSANKDAEIRQLRETYQRDVNALAEYIQRLQAGGGQAQGAKSNDEDDDGFVTRKDLRELVTSLDTTLQDRLTRTLTPLEETRLRDQRDMNRREASRSLEHFDKYKAEIEQLLDAQPVDVSARSGAYEAAYKLVLSQHLDEIIDEKIKARAQPRDDDADEGEPEPEPEPVPERRATAPAPSASATGTRAAVRRPKVPPLTPDERYAAEVMGFKDANEYRQWENNDPDIDIFGFKGRTRV